MLNGLYDSQLPFLLADVETVMVPFPSSIRAFHFFSGIIMSPLRDLTVNDTGPEENSARKEPAEGSMTEKLRGGYVLGHCDSAVIGEDSR